MSVYCRERCWWRFLPLIRDILCLPPRVYEYYLYMSTKFSFCICNIHVYKHPTPRYIRWYTAHNDLLPWPFITWPKVITGKLSTRTLPIVVVRRTWVRNKLQGLGKANLWRQQYVLPTLYLGLLSVDSKQKLTCGLIRDHWSESIIMEHTF